MDLHVFVTMLCGISALATVTTEAIKAETETKKPALVAVIVSVLLSVLVGATYPILFGMAYTVQYAVLCIWLVVLSAICSQVGYDKIKKILEEALGK